MEFFLRFGDAGLDKKSKFFIKIIDNFFKDSFAKNVVWLDVEGASSMVLQGGSQFFSQTAAYIWKLNLYLSGEGRRQISLFIRN